MSLLGLPCQAPQTAGGRGWKGGLKNKCIFSRFWRLGVWDKGFTWAGFFRGSSPRLVGGHLVSSRDLPFLWTCVLTSSPVKDIRAHWSWPRFSLITSLKPLSPNRVTFWGSRGAGTVQLSTAVGVCGERALSRLRLCRWQECRHGCSPASPQPQHIFLAKKLKHTEKKRKNSTAANCTPYCGKPVFVNMLRLRHLYIKMIWTNWTL